MDIGMQDPARLQRAASAAGETAEVQVLADGSMSNMAAVRIAYATDGARRLQRAAAPGAPPPADLDYGEIDGRIRTWYNPNLDSQHFFVPGIVAFLVMLLSLLFTSMAVMQGEGGGHHGAAHRDAAASRSSSSSARPSPTSSSPMAQMVVVILFAGFWFDVPMAGSACCCFWRPASSC
ncbi:MAG: hypothetical protein MZV70_50165 [Desulfobacterales bacterium]|nr:hypothetical protein [Desulfobacterales bacterium]